MATQETKTNVAGGTVQISQAEYEKWLKVKAQQAHGAEVGRKKMVRDKLTIEKALKAGITVTDAEVDAYIAAHPKREVAKK